MKTERRALQLKGSKGGLVAIIDSNSSLNKGEPIVTQGSSLAGQAFLNISRRIMGEQVPFLDLTQPEGFFNRLKKIMGIGSRARHENQRNL